MCNPTAHALTASSSLHHHHCIIISVVLLRCISIFGPYVRYGMVQNRNIQSKENYGPNRTSTVDKTLPFAGK